MLEKIKCANDRCENWFVPKTSRQRYCCRKCCMSVLNRAENKRLREQKKLEPLTREQEKTMEEYLSPVKKSHRGTQG